MTGNNISFIIYYLNSKSKKVGIYEI